MFSLGFRHRQASPVSFSDHQASPVVISDLIDSPGFVGDHLSFLSHCINSPGIAGDQLGISDLIIPPGLSLVALGLDLLDLVLISSVCSRSRRFALDLLAPPVALGLDLLGLLSIYYSRLFSGLSRASVLALSRRCQHLTLSDLSRTHSGPWVSAYSLSYSLRSLSVTANFFF